MAKCQTGCGRNASFNLRGEKKGSHCSNCKSEDMVDIVNKSCVGCWNKQAAFNFDTEKKPMYCSNCKLPNMVELAHKKCRGGCGKRPSFNFPLPESALPNDGSKKKRATPLYCGSCKLEGMVNTNEIFCKCGVTANYNFAGEKAAFCNKCKTPEMIRVRRSTSRCKVSGCDKNAYYFYPGFRNDGKCCAIHRQDGMVDNRRAASMTTTATTAANTTATATATATTTTTPTLTTPTAAATTSITATFDYVTSRPERNKPPNLGPSRRRTKREKLRQEQLLNSHKVQLEALKSTQKQERNELIEFLDRKKRLEVEELNNKHAQALQELFNAQKDQLAPFS